MTIFTGYEAIEIKANEVLTPTEWKWEQLPSRIIDCQTGIVYEADGTISTDQELAL